MSHLPLTTSLRQRCAFNLQQIRSSHPKLRFNHNCPFCAGAGWAALISSHKADSVDVGSGSGASAASSSSSSSSAWTPSSDYLSVRSLARSIGRVVTRPMGEPQSPKKMKTRSSEAASHDQPVAKIEEKQTEEVVQVAGQAVCVIHPRIMITAAHVCFDRSDQCSIRVVYTPPDGSAVKSIPASLIRYSGVMDVSVLRLEIEEVDSPFVPVDIVPLGSSLFNPSPVPIAMACFPLVVDISAHSDTAESVTMRYDQLLKKPRLFQGWITGTTPRKKPSSEFGGWRKFETGECTYPAFAGCSGGGVFASKLSSAGKPQLLFMHTEINFQTGQSQISLIDEFDGADLVSSSSDDTYVNVESKDVIGEHTPTRKRHAADSGSTTPEETTPTKPVKFKLADEVQQKSPLSVGVTVATVLRYAQHHAWCCEALREAAKVPPKATLQRHPSY